MAVFEIQGPDGKIFEVDAPDQEAAMKAYRNQTAGGVVGDAMRGGASGLAQGAAGLLDLPASIPGMAVQGGSWLAEKAGLIEPETGQKFRAGVSDLAAQGGATKAATDVAPGVMTYQPHTTAGQFAQTSGQFLPGMALGGTPGQMLGAGVGSEAAGQFTEGTAVEPYARVAGALTGANAPGAVRSAITPNPADPQRLIAAALLEKEGVKVTAGQKTGNETLKFIENASKGGRQIVDQQADDFTAAALKRIGVDAKRATPDVVKEAGKRIGGTFNDLAARNSIAPDRQLVTSTNDIVRAYTGATNKSNIAPVVGNVAERIRKAYSSGRPLTGAEYQQARTDLAPLLKSGGPEGQAARELRNALDDALGRSVTAAGNPAEIEAYKAAREQYKALLEIEGVMSSAGQDAALGIINPKQLRGKAVQTEGKRNYARGDSDLGDLARAGQATMVDLPNSGTPGRLLAQTVKGLSGGGSGVGGGGLGYILSGGDPMISGVSALAGALAPGVRNMAAGTAAGQRYLGNQILKPGVENGLEKIMAALAGARTAAENKR